MAMTNISEVLDREIERQIEALSKLNPTDDGFKEATEALAKLYKERVAHYATDLDYDNKGQTADNERAVNERKLKIEEDRLEFEKEQVEDERAETDRKLKIEEDRLKNERDQIELERERISQEAERLKQERTNSWLTFGHNVGNTILHAVVEAAGIVLPIIFYHEWVQQGMEFEKEGCFTSSTFKGIIAKLKPTRK